MKNNGMAQNNHMYLRFESQMNWTDTIKVMAQRPFLQELWDKKIGYVFLLIILLSWVQCHTFDISNFFSSPLKNHCAYKGQLRVWIGSQNLECFLNF